MGESVRTGYIYLHYLPQGPTMLDPGVGTRRRRGGRRSLEQVDNRLY